MRRCTQRHWTAWRCLRRLCAPSPPSPLVFLCVWTVLCPPPACLRCVQRATATATCQSFAGLEHNAFAKRVRHQSKLLLGDAPAESLQPLVQKMRKQLRRNRKKVLDTAAGLHELLVKDASWVQDLASLAAAPDLESRMLGLALLLEMKSPAAITSAQKCLRNRAWELRSLAFRYLAVNRDVTSIPLLISRYGAEEGRLKHELETALFLHTGKRCWTRSNWNKWWRKWQPTCARQS